MSTKQSNKKAVLDAISAIDRDTSVGYSFEMPASMYAELARLSHMTKVAMAHYAREALLAYLSSEEHVAHMKKLEAREAQLGSMGGAGKGS